jgi:hypothetical protein
LLPTELIVAQNIFIHGKNYFPRLFQAINKLSNIFIVVITAN